MRSSVVSPVLLCLSGCVGIAGMAGASVKAYDGPEKPDAEIAILLSPKGGGYRAMLAKVDGQTYGDDFLRGFPSTTKVLPGRHQVVVKCMSGNRYAFPSFTAVFEAGHSYGLECTDVGGNRASASYADMGKDYKPAK